MSLKLIFKFISKFHSKNRNQHVANKQSKLLVLKKVFDENPKEKKMELSVVKICDKHN